MKLCVCMHFFINVGIHMVCACMYTTLCWCCDQSCMTCAQIQFFYFVCCATLSAMSSATTPKTRIKCNFAVGTVSLQTPLHVFLRAQKTPMLQFALGKLHMVNMSWSYLMVSSRSMFHNQPYICLCIWISLQPSKPFYCQNLTCIEHAKKSIAHVFMWYGVVTIPI